jgi:hypothetical protein
VIEFLQRAFDVLVEGAVEVLEDLDPVQVGILDAIEFLPCRP